MSEDNWNKTVDYFLSEEHLKASAANKSNRKHQRYTNRGGSSTYGSYAYKESKTRLDAFHAFHTDENGIFDSPVAEQDYNELKRQFDVLSQAPTEEGSAPTPNEVAVFEEVLGVRRGHIRGIGPKPRSSATTTSFGVQQQQTPPTFTPDQINDLFENPVFMARLSQYLDSKGKGKQAQEDEDGDDDEEEYDSAGEA